jgi:hypothetical protein
VERGFIARHLDNEAAVRLGFERMLGSLDSVAGRLLADDNLSRRGQALSHRTEMLEKAAELEAKAQRRQAQADQQLQARNEQATKDRQTAERNKQDQLTAAGRKEGADKARARRQAAARAAGEKQRIAQQSQDKVETAERAEATKRKRIASRTQEATAAPKAQLADANRAQGTANAKHQEAQRLAALATQEREQRHGT